MTLEKFRLDGKLTLITGGTRGIDLAIAQAFGEAGARLVIISSSPVPEAKRSLRVAQGGLALPGIGEEFCHPGDSSHVFDADADDGGTA